MKHIGLSSWIWANELKTILLVILFPVFIFATVFGVLYFYFEGNSEIYYPLFMDIIGFGVPIIVVWFCISLFFNSQIVFSMTGAKEISRKDNEEIYNLVENLCISRGLQTPKIAIIKSPALNAFATGLKKNKAWIVVTDGLVKSLSKKELEAVLAHELTHIINRDITLMTAIAVFIGVVSMLGYLVFRSALFSRDSKKNGIMMIIGLAIWLLSLLVLPLIQLAVSRKREFLADAGAVELTKDNKAMISALQKISGHSQVEKLDKPNLRAMCISSPRKKKNKTSWWSTHPSIDDRINALNGVLKS